MSSVLAEVQGNEPSPEHSDRTLIAPLKHTVKFIAILAALGVAGIVLQVHLHSQPPNKVTMPGGLASRNSFVPRELSLILAEWALLYFVWRGIRLKGMKLRDLIGGSWNSGKRISVDLLLGAAIGLVFMYAIVIPVALILGGRSAHASPVVNPMPPHNVFEAIVWVLASLNAGFCEEVAYRGYLQRQLRALTGKSVVAVLLQAIVFGFVHTFEGLGGAVAAGVAGLLLGLVAWWRKSLRPGMVAHAWVDILYGLFSGLLVKAL
jgi:hypothetical protein